MRGGLYHVVQPVTVAGLEYDAGATLWLSAAMAAAAGPALVHHSAVGEPLPTDPVRVADAPSEEE